MSALSKLRLASSGPGGADTGAGLVLTNTPVPGKALVPAAACEPGGGACGPAPATAAGTAAFATSSGWSRDRRLCGSMEQPPIRKATAQAVMKRCRDMVLSTYFALDFIGCPARGALGAARGPLRVSGAWSRTVARQPARAPQ